MLTATAATSVVYSYSTTITAGSPGLQLGERGRVEWERKGGVGEEGWSGRGRVEWERKGGVGEEGWSGRGRVE